MDETRFLVSVTDAKYELHATKFDVRAVGE